MALIILIGIAWALFTYLPVGWAIAVLVVLLMAG